MIHMRDVSCGTYPEMAQNSINWVFLNIRLEILIACQNPGSAHFFKLENPQMAHNSKRNKIRSKNDSNFEPSLDFRAKKSEPNRFWHVINISSRNSRKTQLISWYVLCIYDILNIKAAPLKPLQTCFKSLNYFKPWNFGPAQPSS